MTKETIKKGKKEKKRENILFHLMVKNTARFLWWLSDIPALNLKPAEVLLLL